MAEKRFILTENGIIDTQTQEQYQKITSKEHICESISFSNLLDICKLLNELAEENNDLKQEMGDLGTAHAEEINKIEDEFDEEILKLENENEQLKKTNQELYDFRLVLNALLFNEWAETGKYEVYKSKKHHDGEPCFDGEWFIVVAILPSGQVTNHYHIKYWDYFKIPAYNTVKDEFDGHTSIDVLIRYGLMLK